MSGFPLLSLLPTHREKVITKFDIKSYARSQQTCHNIYDFVRKSKNISVHLKRSSSSIKEVNFLEVSDPSCKMNPFLNYDIDSFYGMRVDVLNAIWEAGKNLPYCEYFTKNRITCTYLILLESVWTDDKCIALLNILKPINVMLSSEKSDQYEVLLHSKTIKNVKVIASQDNAASVAAKLLPAFPKVEIYINRQDSGHLSMLKTILQILHTTTFPNLRIFKFSTSWDDMPFPSNEELIGQLGDFQLTVERNDEQVTAVVEMPHHFPSETSCRLIFSGESFPRARIEFRM